jgi:hypothetical protein
MNSPTSQSPFVFIHIPKTAGSSFRHHLNGIYGREQVAMVYDRDSRLNDLNQAIANNKLAITGHISLDILRVAEFNATTNPFLFTFIRKPENQVISHFLHKMRDRKWNSSKELFPDFAEFLDSPFGNNWQSHFLSGWDKNDWKKHSSDELKDAAKSNLKKFNFYADTDNYTKALLILRHKLGWKRFSTENRNVSNHHRTSDALLLEFGSELKGRNKVDQSLFTKAQRNCEREYRKLPLLRKLFK